MDRLYVSEGDHYAQHAGKNRYAYEAFSIMFKGGKKYKGELTYGSLVSPLNLIWTRRRYR
jgi:hypothetical protein